MSKSALLCGGSAMAALLCLAASPVFAAAPAAAPAADNVTVGEITVVATRREENIERVPVAVTAFSGQQRQLKGIQTVQDLTDYTPGLSFTSVSDRPYVRGVGRNTDNLSTASAVATYYNGIYYGANAAILLQKDDLFIGNIEVDRGPQNSLHGSNADGGEILYTSQRPTSHFYAEARAGVGSYGEWFGEAAVSGPITDHLKFRLGGNYTDMSGGYFKNVQGGPSQGGNLPNGSSGQTRYVEGQLQGSWDHLDVWVMASTGDFDTNYHTTEEIGTIPDYFFANGAFEPNSFYGLCGLPGVVGSANGVGCGSGPTVVPGSVKGGPLFASQFTGNNPGNTDPRSFLQNYTSTNTDHGDVAVAANVTYHFPSFDLTYLGGFQSFDYELNFTSATDSGVTQYQLAANPALTGTCAFLSGGAGLNPANCNLPLTVNPSPDLTYFAEKDQFFSHELDLTSTGDSPFQYGAGLYWYHEHYNQPVDSGVEPNQAQMGSPFLLGTGGLSAAAANPSFASSTSDTVLTYDSYAAFLSGGYKFNDAWRVSGAIRYTSDRKAGEQYWRFVAFGGPPVLGLTAFSPAGWGANTPALDLTSAAVAAELKSVYPGAGLTTINAATGNAQRPLSATWSAVTGEADVDWTPDAATLAYFRYSRGYKSGGFSTYTIGADPETLPEYVDAFEVGAKRTFGRKLTLNGAAFYYNYYNDQVPLTVQQPNGQLVPQLINLPLVHDYGVELEGVWRPIDPLTLSVQYSYLNTRIADTGGKCFEDTIDPLALERGNNINGCMVSGPGGAPVQETRGGKALAQNVAGNQTPESPPNKISFNALYAIDFDPGKLTLSGSVIWKDTTYDSIFNRPAYQQQPYTQVNVRATYASADGRYTVIAFIDNLFDATGYDAAIPALLAGPTQTGSLTNEYIVNGYSLTAPRTFGLQVQYRFQ